MKDFWKQLPRPFFVLAPMENVTDTVFRRIVASTGKPDVFFTEFTSTGGLCSPGKDKVLKRLYFTETERPLIAQIWGTVPEQFYESAKLVANMGFDGIDINMGCPDKSIVGHGACSGLIRTPERAAKIIKATKEGAGNLPVSVKTRLGFYNILVEDWIGLLLQQDIDALTIHGRTTKEMSKVPAHWDAIGEAVKLRDSLGLTTPIIGNGDIMSREQGIEMHKTYGVDGIMVGRGIFQDIWFFENNKKQHGFEEHMQKLIEHTQLFEEVWHDTKQMDILKKFYKAYIKDFPGASDLRMQLMQTKTTKEVERIVKGYRYQEDIVKDQE